MRIAVVSDTHMPRRAARLPDECIRIIRESDLLVHAGDISTLEALEQMRAIGPPLAAVHGNVDSPDVRRVLPDREMVSASGVRIGLIHDAGPARGRLGRMRRTFPGVDAVIFGHSHLPLVERDGDFQIFNPGSPTDRRRSPEFTMGLAVVEGGKVGFEHVALPGPIRTGLGAPA
jgi:putative phosphoesterase